MKKIVLFIFLIMIVPILASCNSDKYKAERNKIKGIDLENYLTTVNNGEYIETIYNSENTMSIYHLYEYENRYELIKVESFISLELLKDLDKVSTTTSTTTNVLNSSTTVPSTTPSKEEENYEIETTKIVYEFERKCIVIDDVNYDIDEELTKDLFIDYCEEYFNDEFVLINNTLYGIIQEVMTYGDIQMYGSLTLYNQEVLLFHTQISMYDMRSNYKSEKRESFYLEMLIEYIGEDKYTMFMENVYNETLNVMFGAGPIDLVFYVSSDYTTIYPWIDMYNDDNASVTTFYKTTLV